MKGFVSCAKLLGAAMSIFLGAIGCARVAEERPISDKVSCGVIGLIGIVGGASVLIDDLITTLEEE